MHFILSYTHGLQDGNRNANNLPKFSQYLQFRLTLLQFFLRTFLVTLLPSGLVPKQVCSNFPNLDLFTPFCNSISPEMPPDVLERVVSRIAYTAVYLDGTVCRLGAQTVGIVIAHTDLMAQLLLNSDPGRLARRLGRGGDLVHLDGGAEDEEPEHLSLGGELDQRPLDGLIRRQGLAKHVPALRILDAPVNAVPRRAAARACLADAVLVRERLRDGEPVVERAEHRRRRDLHVAEQNCRVVRRHVERPLVRCDLQTGRLSRHDECSDATRRPCFAGCPREHKTVRRAVHPRLPFLVTVDFIACLAVRKRDGFGRRVHVRGVGAVVDLRQAERRPEFALDAGRDELFLLLRCAVVLQHDDDRVVAHNTVLVL